MDFLVNAVAPGLRQGAERLKKSGKKNGRREVFRQEPSRWEASRWPCAVTAEAQDKRKMKVLRPSEKLRTLGPAGDSAKTTQHLVFHVHIYSLKDHSCSGHLVPK